VDVSCEHRNEPSGSIQCWEIAVYLSVWRLTETDSTAYGYLLSSSVGMKIWEKSFFFRSENSLCFMCFIMLYILYVLYFISPSVAENTKSKYV
jgi:hypothetical protein